MHVLGVSLGLCLLCASCGGRTNADDDEDEGTPEPSGSNGGMSMRPSGNGSDTTRPDTVNSMRPASDFAPLPGEDADAWMQRLLVDNCAECHNEASSVNTLIMSRWLLPTDPASSPAIQVLLSRTPPHDALGLPSQTEILQLCLTDPSLREQCRAIADDFGPLLR
jgi:hypothetical protein